MPKVAERVHHDADTDSAQWAQHHTLGKFPNQAAPGNHNHDDLYQPLGGGGGGGAPTGPAGGELTGTYPNPLIADDVIDSANIIDGAVNTNELATSAVTNVKIAPSAVTTGKIADGTITDVDVNAANKDGLVAVPSLRTLGTGSLQAAAGDHTHAAVGLQKYAASLTAFVAGVEKTVTHSLGTTAIQVGFTINASSQEVRLQWRVLSSNAIGVKSDLAWVASAISVTVIG